MYVCLASWFPEAWEKAAQLAEAYKVGRMESAAALNLCKNIDPAVSCKLFELVQSGFQPFY